MPPLPKKNVRRRNVRQEWEKLPLEGRSGRPPAWPRAMAKPDGWQTKWRYLWSLPQATKWESMGIEHVIARYVVLMLMTEDPQRATAALFAELRQHDDKLGLTPRGMRALMWEMAAPATGEGGGDDQAAATPGQDDEEELDYA